MIKVFDGRYQNGQIVLDKQPDLQNFDITGIKVIFDLTEKPEVVEKNRQEMQELLDRVKNSPRRSVRE